VTVVVVEGYHCYQLHKNVCGYVSYPKRTQILNLLIANRS